MNKIYFLIAFSIFFLVLVFFSACTKEQMMHNKLVGDWVIESIKDSTGSDIPIINNGYNKIHLIFEKCSSNADYCLASKIVSNNTIDLTYILSDDLNSFSLYLRSSSNPTVLEIENPTIVKLDKKTLIYVSYFGSSQNCEYTLKKVN